MRVLHSAALLRPPPGILTQMAWEQEAAREKALPWDVRMYCPKGVTEATETVVFSTVVQAHTKSKIRRLLDWVILRRDYYRWLISQQEKYDVFLLRYYVHDPYQLEFVRRTKLPVFFVHHTLEVPELASAGGLSGRIRAALEATLGPSSLRRATGVIAVTNEIAAYEVNRAKISEDKAIIYPNGVMYGKLAADRRSHIPTLLFIASHMAAWHGLDLLLAEVRRSEQEFILHIVGGSDSAILANTAHDNRVVIHGNLSQPEIAELAASCHVGLSSFALFRKNMQQACTLKVREYLMLGLPVYSGYTEMLPVDFPYYRKGACSIDEILRFIRAVDGVERSKISGSAREHIHKAVLLSKLYRQLRERVS